MSEQKSGFLLRYGSARALEREHRTQLSRGELAITWAEGLPVADQPIILRVEAPDGTTFELAARTRGRAPGGFSIRLADTPDRGRASLDMFLRGDRFRRLLAGDRSDTPPEVTAFGAVGEAFDEEEATDPGRPTGEDDLDRAGLGRLMEALEEGADGDTALAPSAGAEDEGPVEIMPAGLSKPGPGEEYVVYVVRYDRVHDFAVIRDKLRSTQRLELEHAEEAASRGKVAQLRLTLPGHNVYAMFGLIEGVSGGRVTLAFDENNENFRLACLYTDSPAARNRLKNEDRSVTQKPSVIRLLEVVPEDDPEKMPIRRRLQRMGMDDKINLALSGGREERMALAMDSNKAIHHYLLRNAKISLDEIAFMARLPTMNPDVLDKIAENPAYTQNPSVAKALVYNPKTPTPTAIRLLDRLPRAEVMNLAKRTNMNMRLVMAAKKKIEGKRF